MAKGMKTSKSGGEGPGTHKITPTFGTSEKGCHDGYKPDYVKPLGQGATSTAAGKMNKKC